MNVPHCRVVVIGIKEELPSMTVLLNHVGPRSSSLRKNKRGFRTFRRVSRPSVAVAEYRCALTVILIRD